MTFQLNLTVPNYSADKSCATPGTQSDVDGATCVQMIVNGYPNAATCKYVDQPQVYTWIKQNQLEPSPYKAPSILRDAVHHFNAPPAPAHFIATANTDAQQAMYSMLLWMRRTNYPATTLIVDDFSADPTDRRWVVITGYKTDMDPESNSQVTLESISFNSTNAGT